MSLALEILLSYSNHKPSVKVHYVWPNRKGQLLIGAESSIPTYETLLELLRRVPGSKSSQTWVERVLNPLAGADIVPAEIPQGKSPLIPNTKFNLSHSQ